MNEKVSQFQITWIAFLFMATLVIGATLGCTVPSDRAMHVLKGAGYTEINLGDYAWYGCGKGDSMSREFAATGPSGQHVRGVVCCGTWGKSCTVRID